MERLRILLADDHPVVRQGLKTFFATQPDLEVVAEAATGAEAVARAPLRSGRPARRRR